MTKNKYLHSYLEISGQVILDYGIPTCIHANRHAIFRPSNASKISIEDLLNEKPINDTQFSRAMKELGTSIITDRSPQA